MMDSFEDEDLYRAGIIERNHHSDASSRPSQYPRKQERESQATHLVKLALSTGAEFFHSGEECYAKIRVTGHVETHSLRSRAIRIWLTHLFFARENKAPGSEAVRSARETLAGFALFRGEERRTCVRIAGYKR
jgi:hypothetical protein